MKFDRRTTDGRLDLLLACPFCDEEERLRFEAWSPRAGASLRHRCPACGQAHAISVPEVPVERAPEKPRFGGAAADANGSTPPDAGPTAGQHEDPHRTIVRERGATDQGSPRLVPTASVEGSGVIELPTGEHVLGRSPSRSGQAAPDLPIAGAPPSVSRRHCRIGVHVERGGSTRVALSDEGSTNGTYRNGRRLDAVDIELLEHGDEVRFGELAFRYEFGPA